MESCLMKSFGALAFVVALSPDPALADNCGEIGRINQSVQAARRQLRTAVDYDKPRGEVGQVCRLSRQIDQGMKRMLAIIQADPRQCGRSAAAVRGLQDAAARSALQRICPNAHHPSGGLTPAG